jgi:hypothetical protein
MTLYKAISTSDVKFISSSQSLACSELSDGILAGFYRSKVTLLLPLVSRSIILLSA